MKLRTLLNTMILTAMILPMHALAQSAPPAPVAIDEARLDVFSAALWVSGTVISRNDAHIGAETDGRIIWVAEVGQRIGAGEAVARVDDADLRLELEDNRAQLESLRAQQRYLKNNLERLNQLAESNNAAANQLDEARADLDMTAQEIRRAEVAVAQAQRRICLLYTSDAADEVVPV